MPASSLRALHLIVNPNKDLHEDRYTEVASRGLLVDHRYTRRAFGNLHIQLAAAIACAGSLKGPDYLQSTHMQQTSGQSQYTAAHACQSQQESPLQETCCSVSSVGVLVQLLLSLGAHRACHGGRSSKLFAEGQGRMHIHAHRINRC